MTIKSRAPVRIDFAGGWSDVPEFADAEGGAVVNAAISLYTHVECMEGGGRIRLNAQDLGERVSVATPLELQYDGKLDLHKAALNMLPVLGGVEIISRSDVPAGSGLGASGSLDVSLLAALARCRDESGYDAGDFAEMGFQLESSELGLLGGRQDQYAAAFGGFHRFGFDASGVDVRSIDVGAESAQELEASLLVVYTGQSHFSPQTHARVWDAYRSGNEQVCKALRAIRDLADAATDAVTGADWNRLAEVVDENWTQQKLLDPTMSTEGTECIEHAARAAGATGVKAAGAGAGGCLIVLAPPEKRGAVSRAAEESGGTVLDCAFDFRGVEVS